MLLHEPLERLHVEAVVMIRVPVNSWSEQVFVPEAGLGRVFLILHVVVGQSRELSPLPGEVTDVERVMEGTKEEESVHDDRPLVNVPPLGWISSIYHLSMILLFNTYYYNLKFHLLVSSKR